MLNIPSVKSTVQFVTAKFRASSSSSGSDYHRAVGAGAPAHKLDQPQKCLKCTKIFFIGLLLTIMNITPLH